MKTGNLVIFLSELFSYLLPLLLSVAFLTLVERKLLASVQRRVGPNLVGFLGLMQPIADAAKLLTKETILPLPANRILFITAPLIFLISSTLSWVILPYLPEFEIELGFFYLFGFSALGVYGIIIARLV